jgi:hypothetical protein
MKRETLKEAQARADHAQSEAWVYTLALQLATTGAQVYARESWTFDGWRYTAKLLGATRADGGIVVISSDTRGQPPHVAAYYLDRWRAALIPGVSPLVEQIACERMAQARGAAHDEAWRSGGIAGEWAAPCSCGWMEDPKRGHKLHAADCAARPKRAVAGGEP